jgi:hypothetical protein
MRATWLGLAGVFASGSVLAHTGPSPDVNNRYVKLSALGDGVRLAYTVHFGDTPGRATRGHIDRDGDGRVGKDEADRFGAELGAEVAAALALELDGAEVAIRWAEMNVGMSDDAAGAGALAVDLVAWGCWARASGPHGVILRDRFALPTPGESELRIEESPGVLVRTSGLTGGGPTAELRWRGAAHPTWEPGFRAELEVDAARAPRGGVCRAPEGADDPRPRWPLAAAAVLALAGLALALSRGRAGSAAT